MNSIASWFTAGVRKKGCSEGITEEKDLKMSRSVVGGEEGREKPSGEQGWERLMGSEGLFTGKS